MHLVSNAARRAPRRRAPAALALLLIFFAAALAPARAQEQPAKDARPGQELNVSDLLKLPGRVLGESVGAKADGQLKLKGYRVEELTLPRVIEAEVRGERRATSRAFRLTLTGGPFPVRAAPPVVWIDDVAVGYGVESEELDAITVVFYDDALLREGATLHLSYGDKEKKEGRTALREKLRLGGAKGGRQ